MGLKPAGLRQSIRNLTEALPANFDVTITSTNAPIDEGQTLNVNYDVENTGDIRDSQTILLEIDNTQEDSEPVTLTASELLSSQLNWTTESGEAGDYTASVISDDDVSSTTVTVEAGIPDSVVLQYYATNWSQGDATWPDDTKTQDMSVTGDPQDGTLSDSSQSADFDGTDDYGTITLPSSLEGSSLEQFAVEATIQYTSSGGQAILGCLNTNATIRWELNVNNNYNTANGLFNFRLEDDSGTWYFTPSNNPNLDDGNRHDVTVVVDDSTTPSVTCIIDGDEVETTFGRSDSGVSPGTWDNDMHIAARYNSGVEYYADMDIGALRWHEQAISNQTISDYP